MDILTGNQKIAVSATLIQWDRLGLDPVAAIKHSVAKVKHRFEPYDGTPRTEPVAIVAFGPSLRDTWQELRNYRIIFTCSGAHKFLVERGIVPTYHVESDPQAHKPYMLGTPQQDTTYLIASTCHPTYFDLLEQYKVRVLLWHLLFTEPELYAALPSREWLMTRGNTVGVRLIKMAYLWKYHNQHMYGFDGSGKHADTHGKPPADSKYRPVQYHGKTFMTTDNLFGHLANLFDDFDHSMPELQYTFHGEGLIQETIKHYKRKAKEIWPMAVMKP